MRISKAEGKLGGKVLVWMAMVVRWRIRLTIQTEGGLQGGTTAGLQTERQRWNGNKEDIEAHESETGNEPNIDKNKHHCNQSHRATVPLNFSHRKH